MLLSRRSLTSTVPSAGATSPLGKPIQRPEDKYEARTCSHHVRVPKSGVAVTPTLLGGMFRLAAVGQILGPRDLHKTWALDHRVELTDFKSWDTCPLAAS